MKLIAATLFVLLHVVLLAGVVPLANLLPAAMGALALTSMAASLVLAARWSAIDRLVGGPDKSYLLHRYLGFFAIFGTLGHWALASGFGAALIPGLDDAAEGAGTLAALGLLGFSAAAMIRAIPYHLWKASHVLMGPVFLLGLFHTLVIAGPATIGGLPWGVMAAVGVVGTSAWLRTLWRRRGQGHQMVVSDVRRFDGGVDVSLTAQSTLPAFRAGQFARLVHPATGAEAHPFTIAGGDALTRRFVIRDSGDWTHRFAKTVQLGDAALVHAGEGRFLPQVGASRRSQLWVAGGVGITPFLAALDRMSPDDGAPVHLVCCLRDRASAPWWQDLHAHARRLPQLRLTVLDAANCDVLSPERMLRLCTGLDRRTTLYLCGPEGLKDVARTGWCAAGRKGRVHDERFDFRGAVDLAPLVGRLTRLLARGATATRRWSRA